MILFSRLWEVNYTFQNVWGDWILDSCRFSEEKDKEDFIQRLQGRANCEDIFHLQYAVSTIEKYKEEE